jgi:hypothetical protein
MSGPPPPATEARPAATARVRRMRAARGACWVIVAGLATAAAVSLLDAAVQLPGWSRGLALAVWVTGLGVLAWRLVFVAWRKEPAARPAQEARRELPGNLRAATAAALALGGSLLATALFPGAVDHIRRVAVPWHRTALAPYRVVVTSGDPVVRRGHAVTLTAYAEKTDSAAPLPAAATLVYRDRGTTAEQRFPMNADGNAAFHAARPAPTDFEYRVEAAGTSSEWFTVTAVDPVELAEGSVTEVQPPRYAPNGARSARPGFVGVEGVQHATAEFRLKFTRPAADAYVEFRADGAAPELTRLALTPDRLGGTATLRLKQDGTLRLVTIADQNGRKLRTEESPVAVRVRADAPPRFETVAGVSPRPMTVRPGERLAISVAATDDTAVDSVVVEYATGPATSEEVTVPLTGAGTARATGRLVFDPADKLKPGEPLRFRLRVLDSRRIDEANLKPQEATYPESGWAEVRVAADSPGADLQEIAGRRDAVRIPLEKARKLIRDDALASVDPVTEDAERPALSTDQLARIENAREFAKTAAAHLSDAARECALCQDLRPLAASIRAVAEALKDADDALRRSALVPARERTAVLAAGRKALANAVDRAEELAALNESVNRSRLDARALADLAAAQSALAKRAATAAPEEVLKGQQELLAGLTRLAAESPRLQRATAAARQVELDRLAARATDLAGAVRDLNAAANEFHATAKERAFAAIVADQKELAAAAEDALARVGTAARLAGTTLPKPEEFTRVAGLIADGKNVDALVVLAQLAAALDAAAATFEKWAAERGDSKAAARHLALWQADLRARFRAATGGTPSAFGALLPEVRAAFRTEQAAVRTATVALRVAPGESTKERDTAVEHVTGAVNFLNGTGANADRAMEIAADHLARLAKTLPTVPERLAKARPEFDKLLREQESITVNVEQVLRTTDPAAAAKKLAPLAGRQERLVPLFVALDLPGFDARRLRTLTALAAAAADLHAAHLQDVPASQAWARREFERFRTALFDNAAPPDDKADELARKLNEAARAALTGGATPALAAAVQDAYKQLGKVTRTPEAAALLSDALESARVADLAFRTNPKPGELERKLRVAADDLARLSDCLNGSESDLDRIRRLAAGRRLAAVRAKEVQPNSPVNPEAARDLGRELEELLLTRVGPFAQVQKKRIADEYARLRDKPAPDRQAGAHAALAVALEELAALAADSADQVAAFDRTPPPTEPAEAGAYLPSRPLADALRDLARGHRTARERITNIPAELARWTKPAKTNPLATVEERQRALAADVSKLVEVLTARPAALPADPYFAESEALLVADHIRNGAAREAQENGDRAARLLRKLAAAPLAKGAGELADRQERLLRDLSRAAAHPGAIAARQRARVEELAHLSGDLVAALEAAPGDEGPDAPPAKTLAEAAATAAAAGKVLMEADEKWTAGKADEAAALRERAEVQFRVAAAQASGAGPAPTVLPGLDPDTAAVGEPLRRAELSMRFVVRALGGKPDAAAVARAMRAAASGADQAARAVRERLGADGK